MLTLYASPTNTLNFIYFYVGMNSEHTLAHHINEIERRQERSRNFERLRIQREDSATKETRLARCCADYARRRQRIMSGDQNNIVGSQTNLIRSTCFTF